MFRHIQRFINSVKSLGQRKPPIPAPLQHIELSSLAPPKPTHNWKASRIRKQRAQLEAVQRIGEGYENVTVAAPEGYFWKQDEGALDRVGRKQWRLYRSLPRGM